MAQTIKLKRTSVPGRTWSAAPTFEVGEMSMNSADEKLWVKFDASVKELHTKNIDTGSTNTLNATVVGSFSGAVYASGKILIQVKDTITGGYQSSELLVAHNGVTASSTEYGVVYTDALLASFDVNYNAGTIEIKATATSTNAMTYKLSKNLIEG